MKNRTMQLLSVVLVLALLFNLLPLQIFAAELTSGNNAAPVTPSDKASLQELSTYVVGEDPDKRTEYSKELLLSDGSRIAAVYADPIHYEKDGAWQEIDNTLKTSKEGTYVNTAGAWSVSLPQSISQTAPVSVTKQGHTLSFFMAGELRAQGNLEIASTPGLEAATEESSDLPMASEETLAATAEPSKATPEPTEPPTTIPTHEEPSSATIAPEEPTIVAPAPEQEKVETFRVESAQTVVGQIEKIDTAAAKAAVQYPEVILDKNASRLQYSNIYANTQLRYDLHGNTLKESVILKSYSSTLRGYRYTLQTGELLPVVNKDGSIYFMGTGKKPVFVMNAPYLIDDAEQCSYDIKVSLTGGGGTYTLTYLLPTGWLADSARAWPVILDPAITTASDVINIRDHTVASNGTYHYERPVLECGYGNSSHVQRIFLKYRNLPTLTSSDVILDAQVALYKIENSSSAITVDVHKVINTWNSETLTWANKPPYDTTVEDYALIDQSGYYIWNVTDIVRGWYSGENTGMMFKAADNYEDGTAATWKQFASSDNGAASWMPTLQITFRNNNGIESYWDYTASSAGRAGTGYVNSYTGNLAWVRSDMGFGGNRMPVSISHVYNLNDSAINEFGMGYGWRTNMNQLVYIWSEDSNYYVWEDSDGTSHYFKKQTNGTYKDEDGLELTLTVSGSTKIIADKNGNKSYFDSSGRLTKIENNQATKSNIAITYSSGKQINTVTDGAGRKYTFTYASGTLTQISYLGSGSDPLATTTFTYANGNLTKITDTDGKSCNYTYSDHVLTTATDVDGYKIQYAYNTPAETYQPYRVQKITEKDGSTAGGSLTLQYDHNQTTFTDDSGNTEILQFNNWGNVTAIMDDEGHAQYAAYATDSGSTSAKGNQLSRSSKLQNTVSNRISDPSFENNSVLYALTGCQVSNTTETAYLGTHAQKAVVTTAGKGVKTGTLAVSKGQTITYSIYVKAPMTVTISAQGGSSAVIGEKTTGNTWQRIQVSYTNNTQTTQNIYAQLTAETTGTFYLDCLQREFAETASRFNILGNGDFHSNEYLWVRTNCESSDMLKTKTPVAAPQLNNSAFEVVGNPDTTKRIYQTVAVSGNTGDTFVIAGWAMGNSACLYKDPPAGQNKREFAIMGTFQYTDGTTSTPFVAQFNPNVGQWQYSAQVMVAKKAYNSIKVYLVYDYNVNTACFDGIGLFKEEFSSSYTYDEDGNVVSVVDLQKQTTTYEYTNNNLTKEILPSGAELSYTYDNYHNVTKATTEEGLVYTFTYDAWGNNTSVSIINGSNKITSTATYSSDGNRLLSTKDALGKVTTYNYDANTNVLKSVKYPEDTDSTKTVYTYDNMYRITSATAKSTLGYTVSGNLQNLSATYTYNSEDYLTGITTPTTAYTFTYGNFGLRTSVKIGSKALATYQYDNITNNLLSLDYGNGDSVKYTYDNKGRVTTQEYEDGTTITYRYDNDGALATVTDSATGMVTTYYYDFLNRLAKQVDVGSNHRMEYSYTYDSFNRVTQTYQAFNNYGRTTWYTYDSDNRIATYQMARARQNYEYDAYGRVNKSVVSHVPASGSVISILTDSYTFVAPSSTTTSNQVATKRTKSAGYDVTYTYTYDDNGNILSISDGTYTTSYEYDAANQLIRENNQKAGYTYVWAYNSGGNIENRREFPYTTGTVNITQFTRYVEYTYGGSNTSNAAWGDLLTNYNGNNISYDQIGNPLDDGTWTYTWQHGRQLAAMTKKDGSATWNYTYGADGLRLSRSNGSTNYQYFYYNGQLLSMSKGSQKIYLAYTPEGTPLSVIYNNGSGNATYYYVTNPQGDVIAILDQSGNPVVRYTYDAWGNQLSCTGSMASTLGIINPLRYRGYVYDQETGLYYVSSRYYDPEIGRWINADGYISTGNGVLEKNMYAYCLNNPVNMVDPSGEIAITTLILIGSIVAGVAVSSYTAYTSHKYTGKVDWYNTILSGLSTFAFCYTYGMSAYGMYVSYCDYKGYTPVTNIGTSPKTNPAPYSNLTDPSNVAPGKDFTASQKAQIIQQNKLNNNGVVKSDLSGQTLVPPQKSMKGVTPPANEWQIDHIIPKSAGGTNSFSNAQVLSREENRIKWDH